jgi:hypothetical protein
MKASKVRIPVVVTYTGYYEFVYEDMYSMEQLTNDELEASPENKEAHWKHGLKKLQSAIKEEIEDMGVSVLDEERIKTAVELRVGPTEEQKLRAIFDKGYAELEEEWRPIEDEDDCEEAA